MRSRIASSLEVGREKVARCSSPRARANAPRSAAAARRRRVRIGLTGSKCTLDTDGRSGVSWGW
jgi:hypothetical protein